ncbi:M23 family metallopeptidase [Geminicoccaceae bacterium 1502E]|nr:M23 family metallopeptidase [Geminicoccaceae bacterium 1502E]
MPDDSQASRLRAPGLTAVLGALLLAGCTTYVPVQMAGDQSWIEARARAARTAALGGTYRVRPGDTLGGIASRHGVATAQLAAANNIAEPSRIYAGQMLRLPTGSAPVRQVPPTVPAGPVPVALPPQPSVQVAELPPLPAARQAPARPAPVLARPAAPAAPAPVTAQAGPAPLVRPAVELPPSASPVSAASPLSPELPRPVAAPRPEPVPAVRTAAVEPVPSKADAAQMDEAAAEATRKAAATRPPSLSGDGFLWPVRGSMISTFGEKPNRQRNDGINVAAPLGTPVRAAEYGVVVYAGSAIAGFGNMMLVRHAGGFTSAYAHLDKIHVKVGEQVERGQVVATVGSTGDVHSPQLHFELRSGKTPLDPLGHLVDGDTRLASAR